MLKIMIEGMRCEHCSAAVTKALQNLGLSHVEVRLADKCAIVSGEVEKAALKAAVEDIGFDVTDIR